MVGTIGFAGSKAREQGNFGHWWSEVGLVHLVAAIVAGAVMGATVGLVGSILVRLSGRSLATVAAAVIALIFILEIVGVPAKYASRARQVPLWWKHVLPAWLSAGAYGAVLGVGLTSSIYYWNFHAFLIGDILLGSPLIGAVGGAAFGLVRAAVPVSFGVLPGLDADTVADRAAVLFKGGSIALRLASAVSIGVLELALLRHLFQTG